jgi:protease I
MAGAWSPYAAHHVACPANLDVIPQRCPGEQASNIGRTLFAAAPTRPPRRPGPGVTGRVLLVPHDRFSPTPVLAVLTSGWTARTRSFAVRSRVVEVGQQTPTPEGAANMETLESARIAFLAAAEGTEQAELIEPWQAVFAMGWRPVLVSPAQDRIQMFRHLDRGDTMDVDMPLSSATENNFAGLVLPGGVANPDQLRTDPAAVAFARSFFTARKPVAAICHAPWTLIEADVVYGRTLTSWPSLRTDLVNAGANWVDEEVVTCENGPNVLVTSRKPDDLPAFCKTVTTVFSNY